MAVKALELCKILFLIGSLECRYFTFVENSTYWMFLFSNNFANLFFKITFPHYIGITHNEINE